MKHLTKFLLVGAVLALAACSNPARFDNAGGAGSGSGAAGTGLPSDPTSVAYFQQAIQRFNSICSWKLWR